MQPLVSRTYFGFPEEELKATRMKYGLRRADRFTSLAITAIDKTLAEMPAEKPSPDWALVTASCFGPHRTVFATLDDILDFPEDQILPTKFSHSVHNASASYICSALKIHGPSFAISGFDCIEGQAMQLAETLLGASMASRVIVAIIEEAGLLTETAHALMPERFPGRIDEISKVLIY